MRGVLGLLLLFPALQPMDDSKPGPTSQQYEALRNEYETALQEFRASYQASPTKEDRSALSRKYARRGQEILASVLQLAQNNPGEPFAVNALTWVMRYSPSLSGNVLDALARDHLDNEDILEPMARLGVNPGPLTASVERFLHEAMDKSRSPRVRGNACFNLASFLKDRAWLVRHLQDHPEEVEQYEKRFGKQGLQEYRACEPHDLARESRRLFERVAQSEADLIDARGINLVQRAKGELFKSQHLAVGAPAPEIEGQDVDGVAFKLSEFRGKVVVLTFSGTWCGPCRRMYPLERELVERLKGKPFVLLSVNNESSKQSLKLAIDSGEVTWRCWYDPRQEGSSPICSRLGINFFPTILVIDGHGVIRYDDAYGSKLNEAVDALLKPIQTGK